MHQKACAAGTISVFIDANHVIGIVKSASGGQKKFGLIQLVKELATLFPRLADKDLTVNYVYISSHSISEGIKTICSGASITALTEDFKAHVARILNQKPDDDQEIILLTSLKNFEEFSAVTTAKLTLAYFGEEDPLGNNDAHENRFSVGPIARVSYL